MEEEKCNIFSGKCICICATSVIVSIFIIASLWASVEPLEYGLECNSFTKTCNTKKSYSFFILQICLQFMKEAVGFFNYFITFPSNYQTIEFSKSREANSGPLNSRTAEGLALGLSLSFQYKLIKQDIPKLYYMANQQYEQTFIRISRDVILQSAGNYEAPIYWTNRSSIAEDMFSDLEKELNKAYCKLVSLQILVVHLPDQYENSIIQTQVEKQNRRMKEFEQQAEIIRQQIKIMESKMNQQIKGINANATAQAYSIKQQANANASTAIIDAEANSLENATQVSYQMMLFLQQELSLNPEELNEYLFDLQMMTNNEAKIFVGMTNAMINVNGKSK